VYRVSRLNIEGRKIFACIPTLVAGGIRGGAVLDQHREIVRLETTQVTGDDEGLQVLLSRVMKVKQDCAEKGFLSSRFLIFSHNSVANCLRRAICYASSDMFGGLRRRETAFLARFLRLVVLTTVLLCAFCMPERRTAERSLSL
jgi:hypothetical protein